MGKTPETTAGPPSGADEMAVRIAAFDWPRRRSAASRPGRLKVVVQLMLGSEEIMAAPWGREGTRLYNDAYSRLIGPRSPMALGRPVFEILPELRPVLERQFAEVIAGRAVKVRDQPYPLAPRSWGRSAP